jgi:hypothetical protein
MKILTEYQKTEITFGIVYFFFVYLIGSYIIYGKFDILNIIITPILFGILLFLSKIIANYVRFNK